MSESGVDVEVERPGKDPDRRRQEIGSGKRFAKLGQTMHIESREYIGT